jgi:hypothetical protein
VEFGEKSFEHRFVELANEFGQAFAHLLAKIVVIPFAASDTDQGKGLGQAALFL